MWHLQVPTALLLVLSRRCLEMQVEKSLASYTHLPHSQIQAGKMGSNKEAYLIQSFLDNASSQLTEHGLVSLHQVCALQLCHLLNA